MTEIIAPVLTWLASNRTLTTVLGGLSVLTFIGTLVVIPVLVARLPADYFAADRPPPAVPWVRHPVVRRFMRLLKNLAGVVFIAAGVAMLVLPGQGLLTILIGLTLIDFPGKRSLERRLVMQPTVLRAVNWLRKRAARPPYRLTDSGRYVHHIEHVEEIAAELGLQSTCREAFLRMEYGEEVAALYFAMTAA